MAGLCINYIVTGTPRHRDRATVYSEDSFAYQPLDELYKQVAPRIQADGSPIRKVKAGGRPSTIIGLKVCQCHGTGRESWCGRHYRRGNPPFHFHRGWWGHRATYQILLPEVKGL
jgi:hypothetical protein